MNAPTRNVAPNGYVRVHLPEHPLAHAYGWVYEHRMVAYDAGLIDAGDRRHVHHKNHDKTDNRLENLAVLTPAAHRNEHALVDWGHAVDLYRSGLTTTEVAKIVGSHAGNVSKALAAAGVQARPTDLRLKIDEELVEQMVRFGVPARRVANHFGCAGIVIARIVRERNLPRRHTGRPPDNAPTVADFLAAGVAAS